MRKAPAPTAIQGAFHFHTQQAAILQLPEHVRATPEPEPHEPRPDAGSPRVHPFAPRHGRMRAQCPQHFDHRGGFLGVVNPSGLLLQTE